MELKEFIAPLRKWWWLIVASTLLATASSYLATRHQPPIYSAHTTLMVGQAIDNPNPSNMDLWLTQQLANTYADIAKRNPVRQATTAALGLSFLPDYSVLVVPNTQLIEIAVSDTDAQRAQAVANEVAQQLIDLTPSGSSGDDQQRRAFIDQQLDELEIKMQETQDELFKKQEELANLFSARQIADTQSQIASLQNKALALQANYAALLANTQRGAVNAITIIEPATLPSSPVGPNKRATILLASAIGGLLALGAAYLLSYLDDSLKNPEDVRKALGLTTLGAVPVIAEASAGHELAMLTDSQSPATEAFRVLRTNLQFTSVDRPLSTLMITSASPSEGKSIVSANLAVALAQAGKRVILIDADLHRPRLHRLFKLRNNTGVTSALLQASPSLDGLLQESEVPGLAVLTAGPLPPNAAELLGSARMKELLAELQNHADIILLDSPPAMALADAAILSTQTDGVILVLDAGKTRREAVRRALDALRQVQARVLGAVLNRMPTRGSGYYYYYQHGSYYGSHNGHGDETAESDARPRSKRGIRRRQHETA